MIQIPWKWKLVVLICLFFILTDNSAICCCWSLEFLLGCCQRSTLCWVWIHLPSSSACTYHYFYVSIQTTPHGSYLLPISTPRKDHDFIVSCIECYQLLPYNMKIEFLKCFDWYILRFVDNNVLIYHFNFSRGTCSSTRRSCQTVLSAHLLSIVRVIAPILPHLAEDVWQNLPFQFTTEDGQLANFVFESRWPILNQTHLTFPEEDVVFWGTVLEVIINIFYNKCISSWNSVFFCSW